MLATGSGAQQAAAEDAARANLAKLFAVRIQQTQESREQVWVHMAGGKQQELNRLAIRSQTTSEVDQTLTGAKILARAAVADLHYALAGIERRPAVDKIAEELSQQEIQIDRLLAIAESADVRLQALHSVARAITLAQSVAVGATRYQLLHPAAETSAPAHPLPEILGRYRDLLADTRARVELEEKAANRAAALARLRQVMEEALTSTGLSLADDGAADLVVRGALTRERRSQKRRDYTFERVEWRLEVELWEALAGEPVRRLRLTRYLGSAASQDQQKAERIALEKLAALVTAGAPEQPSLQALAAAVLLPATSP